MFANEFGDGSCIGKRGSFEVVSCGCTKEVGRELEGLWI